MRLLTYSERYKFPSRSIAKPDGSSSFARTTGPPSPLAPEPATVESFRVWLSTLLHNIHRPLNKTGISSRVRYRIGRIGSGFKIARCARTILIHFTSNSESADNAR